MQVEEEKQGDGEVDVVGIYGFWVNGVNGGVALSRSRLALRSNDGIALCQAERSATANWAPADWVQPERIRFRTRLRFKERGMPVRQLPGWWCQVADLGGRCGRSGSQRQCRL